MLRKLTMPLIVAGTLLFAGCFSNANYYADEDVVDGDSMAEKDEKDIEDERDDVVDELSDLSEGSEVSDEFVDETVDDDSMVEKDEKDIEDIKDDMVDEDAVVDDIVAIDDTVVPDADIDEPAGSLKIRFVAANLTSGNYQSYDPGHGIRLMAGTKGDIFMVQEFNYGSNSASDYRAMTDDICGAGCDYAVGTGSIPNGVVSRWPITGSGYWDDPNISDRNLDWARIDIPGSKDILVVSVHLHTSPSSDQVIAAQVVAKKVTEHRAANPNCCYYVVGGDFNGPTSVSADGFGEYNGQAVFYVANPDPVGEDGSTGTNASRSSQYDFVLLDTALHAYQTAVLVEPTGSGSPLSYPSGLVFDSRDFSQSELDNYFPPALTGDSGASNMQHMAILKDILLP